MIELIDRSLKDWVTSVVGSAEVSFAAPSDTHTGQGVGLYLLELAYKPSASSTFRLPLQLSLHYLVTTWAESAEQAHHLLGKLIFAAIETPDFEVQIEPIPVAVWVAFHVVPRPAFVLRVPLKRDRPQTIAPPVRVAPDVQVSPSTTLQGQVVGPSDMPLMGAQVELAALKRTTVTNAKGEFEFAAVPTHPPIQRLYVTTKGHRFSVHLEPESDPSKRVIIHLHDLLHDTSLHDTEA
ncbi:Pvc16 family protein [Leptolyngbya sp. AN02str]|uniref:Pvc16 family protein n=1 Tax=Leptolyngbya sp. AN02str TaxID=3423363 RepID=UPI003D322203